MSERIDCLRPEFVDSFPGQLEPGVLYVSIPYRTCGHLCACGCDEEVITPLDPRQWSISFNGQDVSLSPSIGNWSLPCRSHYIISHGRVVWSRRYSDSQINEARRFDRIALGIELPDSPAEVTRTRWWRLHRRRTKS